MVLFEESVPTADEDELLPLESEDESLLDELLPLESEDESLLPLAERFFLANGTACVGSIPREI